ncbi:unnamed protein product [Linum tenue]|uniref:Pentatricopeptide repeat-containing protein n=1 Tax=Linum tenue TaxID=586396 RepID=A0AAV0JHN3_9ROSI|nr:unnamed protein product [Linum tenue]
MLNDGDKEHSNYSNLISLCAKIRNVPLAMSVFISMEDRGIQATASVFNSLILTCLFSNEVITALSLFEVMESSETVRLDSQTYHTFILGFSNFRDISRMLDWFEISGSLIEKVVKLYCELEKPQEMEMLLNTLVKFNQVGEALLQVHCGILRLYASLDRLDDVEYSVGRMMSQGMSFSSPCDVERVISAYFRHEAYDRLDLFLEHVKRFTVVSIEVQIKSEKSKIAMNWGNVDMVILVPT